jgi:hypothetical protein
MFLKEKRNLSLYLVTVYPAYPRHPPLNRHFSLALRANKKERIKLYGNPSGGLELFARYPTGQIICDPNPVFEKTDFTGVLYICNG